MTIKIYGLAGSPFVQLVAVVAAQAGVQYEFVALPDSELKSAAYLEKQPFAEAPCLVRHPPSARYAQRR